MKNDWTFRWWDLIALAAALVAAVLVVRYAVSHGAARGEFSGLATAEVRVPRPLPELAALISQGDQVVNAQGEKVAEIISVQPVPAIDSLPAPVPLSGRQDLIIKISVTGALRLVRNHPGFPQEPAALKAGVWCLLETEKVELAGMIVHVEFLKEERRKYLSSTKPPE